MKIGIPKEIKDYEARVAISPAGVTELTKAGHKVFVEKDAGARIGYDDKAYKNSGAKIIAKAADLYEVVDLIVKVKEPQESEVEYFKKDQILFSYLHLAAEEKLTRALLKKGVVAISYETVFDEIGSLPLLKPMSEIAGKLSVQFGANVLQQNNGGKGVLLGGVTGVPAARVTIIGGGVVGKSAAIIARGMGAKVTILEKSLTQIQHLNDVFGDSVRSIYANTDIIAEYVRVSDLLIGAVLVPGAAAPKIVDRKLIAQMTRGSVIVDVAIDQGGCFETSRATSHSSPTYEVDGVIHYCVTNMPAAASRTASRALENATIPYILNLANQGYKQAFQNDPGFAAGLNVYYDKITIPSVAKQFGLDYLSVSEI